MNPYILFGIFAVIAVIVVFVIMRAAVYFVSAIPKWLYVLVILAVIFGVAFVFFGETVRGAFGL
ncbi:MAG: hypothetical protein LBR87_04980 [Synergistaceae bacterium]|jgi:cell division protein FtsW (lipid II flippase)|nr:hypothetical protein [Synergistaceae bacterium]